VAPKKPGPSRGTPEAALDDGQPEKVSNVGRRLMLDWRLQPSSGGFREANDCHKPGGSPDGGQFCSTAHVGTQEFLARHPAYATEVAAYAEKHGQRRLEQDVDAFWSNQRKGPGIPSAAFQLEVLGAGRKRQQAERRVAKAAATAAVAPKLAAQLKQKHGLAKGDVVFDTETGTRGVVKVDRDGQPYVQSAMGRHYVGVRWKKAQRESNDCHKPGGSPDGGQFCSTVQSIAKSFAYAQTATEAQHRRAGAWLAAHAPLGATVKLGRSVYTRQDVSGDTFWVGPKHGLTDQQMAVELGTRAEKLFGGGESTFSRVSQALQAAGHTAGRHARHGLTVPGSEESSAHGYVVNTRTDFSTPGNPQRIYIDHVGSFQGGSRLYALGKYQRALADAGIKTVFGRVKHYSKKQVLWVDQAPAYRSKGEF